MRYGDSSVGAAWNVPGRPRRGQFEAWTKHSAWLLRVSWNKRTEPPVSLTRSLPVESIRAWLWLANGLQHSQSLQLGCLPGKVTCPPIAMSHPEVLGVVVLARNGDRTEAYQDPVTYQPGPTLSTPLGEVCCLVCLCGLILITCHTRFNPINWAHICVTTTSTQRVLRTSGRSGPILSTSLRCTSA